MTKAARKARRTGRDLGTVEEVAAAWGVAEKLLGARPIGRAYRECLKARVESSRRAKTQAGIAYTDEGRIVLNAALLEPGREADRNATLLHECGHIIANLRYGWNCRHDKRWRRVMAMLGEPAEVSHTLSYLSRAHFAVMTWECVACGEQYHFVRRPRRRIQDCYCTDCGPLVGRLLRKPRQEEPALPARDSLPPMPGAAYARPVQLDLFAARRAGVR